MVRPAGEGDLSERRRTLAKHSRRENHLALSKAATELVTACGRPHLMQRRSEQVGRVRSMDVRAQSSSVTYVTDHRGIELYTSAHSLYVVVY